MLPPGHSAGAVTKEAAEALLEEGDGQLAGDGPLPDA
jgi:hypothetical protein